MAWDWSRTIDTSDPDYYRWTQWLLTRLFDAGLMYQAEAPVVWCPSCLTVLAREQTEHDGTACERCGTRVTEKVMTQWFLRITAYADRLHDGLERSGLAGARQAPATAVDRPRRRRHDPAARLADLAPALLGPADPDRALRRAAVRSPCPTPSCRSCCPTSTTSVRRAPAGHRWLPPRTGCGRRVRAAAARRARDRRERHVRRLGVVLPAVPVDRLRRPPVGRRAHGPHVAGRLLRRRSRARATPPPVRPVRDDGAARSRAGAVRGAVPAGPPRRSDRQGRGKDVEEPRQRRDARRLHRPPRRRHVAVRAAVLRAVGTGR